MLTMSNACGISTGSDLPVRLSSSGCCSGCSEKSARKSLCADIVPLLGVLLPETSIAGRVTVFASKNKAESVLPSPEASVSRPAENPKAMVIAISDSNMKDKSTIDVLGEFDSSKVGLGALGSNTGLGAPGSKTGTGAPGSKIGNGAPGSDTGPGSPVPGTGAGAVDPPGIGPIPSLSIA